MKYKVGDKVRYDSGEWWFYGTVSAIIENSISPCYRMSVERMEKKACKFSITQFEFELEADTDVESNKEKHKWESLEMEYLKKYSELKNQEADKGQQIEKIEKVEKIAEPEPVSIPEKKQSRQKETVEIPQIPEKEAPKRRTGEAWVKNLELYQKGERSSLIFNWISQNRRLHKEGLLTDDKYDMLVAANFQFAKVCKNEPKQGKKAELTQKPEKETPTKRKRGEAWELNYEAYRKGEKNNLISTWMANNRREYKTGKLSEEKFEKLMAINFPFDVVKKKRTVIGKDA